MVWIHIPVGLGGSALAAQDAVGAGCDVCMRVRPRSHERTRPDRLTVDLTRRNRFNQKLFTPLDDVFYGRKPGSRKGPEWARYT